MRSRIPQRGCRPAGVDKHRLARRRDDERRLTALDVDEVQLQRLRRREGRALSSPQRTAAQILSIDSVSAAGSHGRGDDVELAIDVADDADDQQLERRRARRFERLRLIQLNRHRIARPDRSRLAATLTVPSPPSRSRTRRSPDAPAALSRFRERARDGPRRPTARGTPRARERGDIAPFPLRRPERRPVAGAA